MKKVILILLCFILFFSCASRAALKRELAVEYYNLGNYYYENNNITEAVKLFKKAVSFNPELVKANYNLTLVMIMEGEADEANEILSNLLAEEPENVSLLQLLGYSYYIEEKNEDALNIFNEILEIQPEDLNAVYNKGIVLWKMGKTDQAIECFNLILDLTDDSNINNLYGDSLYALGEIMISAESWQEAADYLNRYLEINETDEESNAEALFFLVEAFKNLERFDKVVDSYNLIIESDEENVEAWIGKAEVLLTKIEFPVKGLEALTKAIELGFNDPERLRTLIDDPELTEKESVEKLLMDNNVYPPEIEETEEEESDIEEEEAPN
jgi:tetratricopeptide (TPR) repeat protein